MFVKPTVAPKVIPGPPAFDPNNTNVFKTGGSSIGSGTLLNTVSSLAFGGSNNSQTPSTSLSTVFAENVNKFKKYPDRAHWGLNNLFAYCSQNFVVVFDPTSVQMITCLSGHQAVTTATQWSSNAKTRGMERGNSITLASGDENGVIMVWDVKKAKRTCVFEEDGPIQKRSIVALRWIYDDSVYLLSLTSGYVLSLWNVQTRTKVWRYEFAEPVTTLSLDPFTNSSAAFPTETGWIIIIHDLNVRKAPTNVEQKLRADVQKEKNTVVTSLRDFVHSPHARNQMFLVSKRDVTFYDLDIRQQLAGKVIRAARSDFRRIYTSEESPSSLFTLQEDGTVAAWEYNETKGTYEAAICDIVRGSKHGADRPGLLYGLSFSPLDPNKLAAVSADGKLWVWDYIRDISADGTMKFRWVLQGLLETTSSTISCLQVSPFGNEVAVGTSNGTLLVYNLMTGALQTKHDMFNLAIQGLRWFSETDIVCFSSKKVTQKNYINDLVAVDLKTGKHKALRTDKKTDESPIRAIRVSYSMKYLIVLPQDRPLEVYSLRTFSLLRLLPFTNITAVEWCPNRISRRRPQSTTKLDLSQAESQEKNASDIPSPSTPSDVTKSPQQQKKLKEHFYFTSADGSLHFYSIEDEKVVADSKKPKMFNYNQVSALAWKNDFLVSGDNTGNISYWEISKQRAYTIPTHRGLVRKILFSPENYCILVHFAEGDFGIWDLETGNKVGHSLPGIKASCLDWISDNHPVIATNAGSIMVWDLKLTTNNSSPIFHSLIEPLSSPTFLPINHSQYLRSLIENNTLFDKEPPAIDENSGIRNAFGEIIADGMKDLPVQDLVLAHTQLMGQDFLRVLRNPETTTAKRCYLAAKFFGDKVGMQFWKMADEYLSSYKKKNEEQIKEHGEDKVQETKQEIQSKQDSLQDSGSDQSEAPVKLILTKSSNLDTFNPRARVNPLPAVFDLLRDNESVLHDQMTSLKYQDETVKATAHKGGSNLFSKVAQDEAVLDQKDQAVKLLLETPLNHKDLYFNYLHACVIAAANSNGDQLHFKQTMQFVASNLISLKTDKEIDYGVELLCLIGEGFKACKILQDFDKWEKAARLAKCILPDEQSRIILTRWADHLTSNNSLMKAIGIFLSLGLFKEVIDILHKSELDDIGALFAKACLETGFDIPTLHKKSILRVTNPTALSSPSYSIAKNHDDYETTCKKLLYFIYQQYGTFLQKVGNEALGEHFKSELIKAEELGLVKEDETQQTQSADSQEEYQSQQQDSESFTIISPSEALPDSVQNENQEEQLQTEITKVDANQTEGSLLDFN